MIEEWKDIVGYEGLYLVSNFGKIKSIKRDKLLSPGVHRDGYLKVTLHKKGKKKTFQVHRLVALAFVPMIPNKNIVNHEDGNKQNNYSSNLKWSTTSENTQHAYDTGLAKGHNGGNNKIVLKVDAESGVIIESYDSITEAAAKNNTYRRKIYSVLDKEEISLGYIWRKEKKEKVI